MNYSFVLFYSSLYGLEIVDNSIKSHGSLHKKKTLGHTDFYILIFSVHLLKEEKLSEYLPVEGWRSSFPHPKAALFVFEVIGYLLAVMMDEG